MKFFRFFKGHLIAVLACAVLLAIQATFELSLPNYMSNIVDVGLQQRGIESPVPNTIRADELSNVELFMTEADSQTIERVYSAPDADDIRTYTGSSADAQEGGSIAKIMELPECIVLALDDGVDPSTLESSSSSLNIDDLASQATDPAAAQALMSFKSTLDEHNGKITMEAIRILYDAGLLTREELIDAAQAMNDAMGDVANTMLAQRAISFVQREYEAQGIDLQTIQDKYLQWIAGIMFALCAGTLVTTICVGLIASRTAAVIARDTRKKLFARVMSFSAAEVNKFSQASLITRTTNDLQQIQMVCVMLLRMVMLAPIMGIIAFAQVTATHSGMEWIIGVALIAIFAALGILLGVTMPKFKRMQSLVDRLNLVSRDMLDGIMPIRAFGREAYELDRFDDASTALMRTQLFVNRAMSFMMPVVMLVMNLITLLIVWIGCQGISMGTLQVGTMMAFITYTMQIVMSFMILGMVSVMLPRAQVSAERVGEVLACEPSITDPTQPQLPCSTAPKGRVELDNVTFAYPEAERPVIRNVSFITEAGKTLGIIGSTGSGKSTLVKLIPRLYDVSDGRVLIDGVDVRDMTISEVRRRIGYVPQQGFLFSGTIASNIKFADEQMPDEQMENAAKIAQAMEFIDQEPDGFASPISQKGANVSGGQRQRLSIARALAAEPEILIFDDAFSALDYTTDARLREALKTGSGNAAVIIVAQRVATIMQADEILVLEGGSVVGRGTHTELLASCETYREIALSQLSAAELGIEEAETILPDSTPKGGDC